MLLTPKICQPFLYLVPRLSQFFHFLRHYYSNQAENKGWGRRWELVSDYRHHVANKLDH